MNLSNEMLKTVRCPKTKCELVVNGEFLEPLIRNSEAVSYPIIDGIPVLIDDAKSLFSIDDFKRRESTTSNLNQSKIKKFIWDLVPSTSANINAKKNYNQLCEILPSGSKILIIGGRTKGVGMDAVYSNESFEIVSTDVSFGGMTSLICDAHDIPFDADVFDCVIVQAVLEHILEPQKCVDEVHRVLKSSGIVYAETPFMQQVHGAQYDFTRFTNLGHRRLFRYFDELGSGPTCGPGMALAWSYTYFLKSFSTSRKMTRILTIFARLTSFYLKYFDYYLINKPGSYDAASGLYFMGSKSNTALSDLELINQFKGLK